MSLKSLVFSIFPQPGAARNASYLAPFSRNYGGTFARNPLHCSHAARLVEIAPQRIVDNDGPAIGEGFDRMADVRWYDRD